MNEIEYVKSRPFQKFVIKPRHGTRGAKRRVVLRLNVERRVGNETYHLVLIPFTPAERIGLRRSKTRSVAPYMPDRVPKPTSEFDWIYDNRPSRMVIEPSGHLQFVNEKRLEVAQESSPWAG